jgi:(S)-mandelate dehydrogenase
MGIAGAINIEDLRRAARARLPKVVTEYLEGGAEDEVTVAANREAFRQLSLVPRITAGIRQPDLSVSLFGERLELPFVVGPTGLNGIFWRGADSALAHAAEAAKCGFALATAANESIEQVGAATRGVKWFQLYPWGGPPEWKRLLERARGAGFTALVVTVDSLLPGNRERDRRNQFAHDVKITPRTVLDGLLHPRWLCSVYLPGLPRFENLVDFVGAGADVHALATWTRKARSPAISWEDLALLRRMWSGPFLVKGVLAAEDAVRAVQLGADGIVVSNHGGRQLDGVITTLEALPAIVEAAGDHLTVLVDSGFRRGTDVIKALALGAKAVTLGRAPLYGVAAAGQAGAARALEILAEESSRAMHLLGCPSVADLSPRFLHAARDARQPLRDAVNQPAASHHP